MTVITDLQRVKDSADFVKTHPRYVQVKTEKINEFIQNLDLEELKKEIEPRSFPLNFQSLNHEVNFYCLYSLLQFGSGYRHELHKECDRGASDTIVYGLMSMVIGGSNLDAQYMTSLSINDICGLFNIPQSKDVPTRTEGISEVSESETLPLARLLQKVLQDSGDILRKHECVDFGQWIDQQQQKQQSSSSSSSVNQTDGLNSSRSMTASSLVHALRTTFPAFNDVGELSWEHGNDESNGEKKKKTVWILKKAQLCAAELYRHMRDRVSYFDFPDIDQLTVFSDNVIPATLRKMGILEFDDNLKSKIESRENIPAGEIECEIRLAAIAACEEIAANISDISGMEIDYYLWQLGKTPEYRRIERHATKDTVFY
eukprot:gb/GECH01001938.1/.p1 GENE.gb/GECH01001938.1/~~gb/GECH01001938.1/.p1  ORF type:complete len:372 (+),score=99.81 gb/GECH01001938.1/:1-1116(+)